MSPLASLVAYDNYNSISRLNLLRYFIFCSYPLEIQIATNTKCLAYLFNNHVILKIELPNAILAATKQLYEWFSPSVCPSVRLPRLFNYVLINVSSWNFQKLLLMTEVISMQKVMVRG